MDKFTALDCMSSALLVNISLLHKSMANNKLYGHIHRGLDLLVFRGTCGCDSFKCIDIADVERMIFAH